MNETIMMMLRTQKEQAEEALKGNTTSEQKERLKELISMIEKDLCNKESELMTFTETEDTELSKARVIKSYKIYM